MKHLILSFLLLCGTMSFAATPQQYEVAIDDSLQHIVSWKMQYSLNIYRLFTSPSVPKNS